MLTPQQLQILSQNAMQNGSASDINAGPQSSLPANQNAVPPPPGVSAGQSLLSALSNPAQPISPATASTVKQITTNAQTNGGIQTGTSPSKGQALVSALSPADQKLQDELPPAPDISQESDVSQDTHENSGPNRFQQFLGKLPFGGLFQDVSELVGAGPLEKQASAPDLFQGSNVVRTPLDSTVNSDYAQMQQDKPDAQLGGIFANKYAADQTQLAQDEAQRDSYLNRAQNVGDLTPDQSAAFHQTAAQKGAVIKSSQDITNDLNPNNPTGQNPQQLGGGLVALAQYAGLDAKLDPSLQSAATNGNIVDWFSDPKNVYAAKAAKGVFLSAYDAAVTKNEQIDDTYAAENGIPLNSDPDNAKGTNPTHNRYDTSSPNFALVQKSDANFGKPNGGLADRATYFNEVNNLGNPTQSNNFNAQGLDQNAQIARFSGEYATNGEENNLLGLFLGAAPGALKALQASVNAISPGEGDRLAAQAAEFKTKAQNRSSNAGGTTSTTPTTPSQLSPSDYNTSQIQNIITDARGGNQNAIKLAKKYNINY